MKDIFSVESISLTLRRVLLVPLSNLDFFFSSLKLPKSGENKRLRNIIYAFAGIMLSLPFVVLLLSLLTKADPIFSDMYDHLIDSLHINLTAGRFIVDLTLGFTLSMIVGASLIYASLEKNGTIEESKMITLNPLLGFCFTLILNILLGVFSYIQIRYLFIGEQFNKIIEEIGYAQYAREGFFELCYASFIVFLLAATVLWLCRKEEKNPIYIRISVLLMSLFSVVLAVSSAKRMLLYVKEYGLSVKRISTFFGITVITVSLFWLLMKCVFSKLKALKVIGISLVILITAYSFVNIDRVTSSYNVGEYMSGTLSPDVKYFHELTYTSIDDALKLYEYTINNQDKDGSTQIIQNLERYFNKKQSLFTEREIFSYTYDDIRISKVFKTYVTIRDISD
ncbi:MAG: DUF4173 domain-containing protein [Oscillospiraceae bacterium]|nr:DUF4173 domain-containing protein [Oscillospiraceae bacterium]